MVIALFFLFFILLFVGANLLAIRYEKQKIRSSAAQKGWTVVGISYRYILRGNYNHFQFFGVDFVDEKGQPQSSLCRTNLFSGVEWDTH